MSTFSNAPTQEIGGGGLSSREGKRNRKAQALSALLSASALGLFLEGCGGSDESSSSSSGSSSFYGRRCYSDPGGLFQVSCSSSRARYESYGAPLGVASASAATVEALALSIEGGSQSNAGDAVVLVGSDEGESLLGSASDDFLEGLGGADILDGGDGADTASYTSSDVGVAVDLSTGKGEKGDAEGDIFVSIENLVGSAHGDSLTGDAEANTLEGGGGDDTLVGGAGADTYVFAEGDGANTIVEVGEEGVVNTLRFEGDYEVSDFSFARSSEDGTDLVIVADTDGDGQAENEVTLEGYFVSETGAETAYSIELQINDEEAFVPSLEG